MRRGVYDWRAKHATVDPRSYEVIGHTLWDQNKTFTSATTTQINFFDAVPANKFFGNIQIASQLPAGISVNIGAIRFFVFVEPFATASLAVAGLQTGLTDDLVKLYTQGVFTLDILNKRYAEYPLWMLHPGSGAVQGGQGSSTVAAPGLIVSYATWGNPDPRAVHTLSQPITIPPQTNFTPSVTWPNGSPTLASTSPVRVGLVFDGEIIRPKQ